MSVHGHAGSSGGVVQVSQHARTRWVQRAGVGGCPRSGWSRGVAVDLPCRRDVDEAQYVSWPDADADPVVLLKEGDTIVTVLPGNDVRVEFIERDRPTLTCKCGVTRCDAATNNPCILCDNKNWK